MSRQNLNVDGKIGGRKGKVRKRGCSSSSSSSLAQNYRLKRSILVGKRGGSTTPVPMWKLMSSDSQSLENDKAFKYLAGKNGGNAKELSVSARKLAAILWEINGMPSPRVKMEILEDKMSEVGMPRKERILVSSKLSSMELGLCDPFHITDSERMDLTKLCTPSRRALAGSQKLLQASSNMRGAISIHSCLLQVDQTQNHAQTPFGHRIGLKNHLKDVYNGRKTSRELLKVLSRIWGLEPEQLDSTSSSLVSALKVELYRACNHVNKLIQGQRTKRSEIDILLKQIEEDKVVSKIKEQDSIHSTVTSLAGELKTEKKLRRKTEKLNKKLGAELVETKGSLTRAIKELEREKKARRRVEQVCDELARGVGELKREFAKVRKEVEKEREMFQLADVLREGRVQMKLSEAKCIFEEKNALVDKLRNELVAYLKSNTGNEQGGGSPRYDKTKELEKYLRETFPGSHQNQDKEKKNNAAVNKEDEEEEDESADSDFNSIELNVDNISKSFQWGDALKIGSKRNSVDRSKGRKCIPVKTEKLTISSKPKTADGIVWESSASKQENQDLFDSTGFSEFTSHSSKRDIEDKMERYNTIKDLRDHIVSVSRMASSQDLASQVFTKQSKIEW